MTNKNFIIIALGSNLGDRHKNLKNALRLIRKFVKIEKCSVIYKSKALLPKGAPKEWSLDFYNCVLVGKTLLKPQKLIGIFEDIEESFAPKKREKGSWAPRYLDIDIIAFNDEVIKTSKLVIPHEKMHERSFVLQPLAEIMPEWVHPLLKKNATELLENLSSDSLETKKTRLKIV